MPSAGSCISLLCRLPEWDLAHLHARLIATTGRCPPQRSYVFCLVHQLLRLTRRWLRRLGTTAAFTHGASNTQIWAYVATRNQWNAIQPILDCLRARDRSLLVLVDPDLDAADIAESGYETLRLSYGPRVILCAFFLLLRRLPVLWSWCVKQGLPSRFFTSLSEFALAYPLLLCAPALLRDGRPLLMLLANDHTPDSSALWVAATDLGLPTAYVQHAFVTSDFPPLHCTLNFLYGRFALEAYLDSAARFPSSSLAGYDVTGGPLVREVVLTGAVSRVRSSTFLPSDSSVGLGINHGDDPDLIGSFVRALSCASLRILIRPHPRYPRHLLHHLRRSLVSLPNVLILAPSQQSLESFLGSISVLVAGDSSLHLDAALAGIACFYLPGGRGPSGDYYGFRERGLVRPWPEMLLRSLSGQPLLEALARYQAPAVVLREYSLSFASCLQGHESNCIAAWIDGWLSGVSPEVLGAPVQFPEAPFPVYRPDLSRCLADRP